MNPYLSKAESLYLNKLVHSSTEDKYLGDIALSKKREDTLPLYHEGEMVGFAIPRKDWDGRWRTGPIFIRDEHRGKGIASGFIKDFFMNRPGRSYINADNLSSLRAFSKAGFAPTGKTLVHDGEKLDEYHIN